MPEADRTHATAARPPDAQPAPVRGALAVLRTTPGGRLALKLVVGVVGTLVVALGILMIPLPGPGWAVVMLGLTILAAEFTWARRLLSFTRRRVRAWAHWLARRPRPVRLTLGGAAVALVAAAVLASVYASRHVDLVGRWLDALATT
jgi:uncharacterized protein (TIGR02611 family)